VCRTGRVVNVKKGQFLAPEDMGNVVAKLEADGTKQILLTERARRSATNARDGPARVPIMARTGYPVVFDGTHSVQRPGGLGDRSGGDREMIPYLSAAPSRAASTVSSSSATTTPTTHSSDGRNTSTSRTAEAREGRPRDPPRARAGVGRASRALSALPRPAMMGTACSEDADSLLKLSAAKRADLALASGRAWTTRNAKPRSR